MIRNTAQQSHSWIRERTRELGPSPPCENVRPEVHIPKRRSSNASSLCWRLGPEPTGFIMTSQIHGSRVRVLPPPLDGKRLGRGSPYPALIGVTNWELDQPRKRPLFIRTHDPIRC